MSPAHYADLTGEQTVIRVGAATHVGRVRELNEDALVAEGLVFAVADGMGGHAAGEVASTIAALTLRDLSSRHPGNNLQCAGRIASNCENFRNAASGK
mgnify:CR=1 FL=1